MRILLGTHAFPWWSDDAPEISPRAKRLIADPGTEVLCEACREPGQVEAGQRRRLFSEKRKVAVFCETEMLSPLRKGSPSR